MNRMKQWSMLGVSVIVATSILAACGKNDDSSGGKAATIKYLTWDYSDRTKSTDAWMADLKDKYKITVDMQNIPTDQYPTTFKTKFASNDIPDLLVVHGLDQNLSSVAEKVTIDGDKFVDLSDLKALENFLPAVYNDRKKNKANKLFYVPVSTNALGVIYNKKVFSDNGIALPTNYDEFIAICEKLNAAGITPIAAGFKDSWTTQIIPLIAFGQYVNTKDDTIKVKLADGTMKYADIKDDTAKALKVQLDWADKGYFQKDFLGTDINVASQMVGTGKAAMLINGTWQYQSVQDADPNAEIGFFALPLNAAGEKTVVPSLADSGIMLNAESKNVDAAKEALEYYLSPENQTRVIADLNGIPTNTKVTVSSPFVKEAMAAMAAGQIQPDWWAANGYYMTSGTAFDFAKESQNLVAKGITIDGFIAKFDEENAKALKK